MPVETALVVDDSKSARIMLSRLLQKTGLQVEMVESGEEAIEHLQNNARPDVIFMDHMMPGMDGLETTKAICQIDAIKHIPILMYTSKEGPEYEAEMMACGAYGMLGKPAKPERLRELIEELNARPAPVAETPAEETGLAETAAEETIDADTLAMDEVPETSVAASLEEPEPLDESTLAATQPEPIQEQEQEEEEEMSKELIEEVSAQLIARAIEDALQPIKDTMGRLETNILENQSDIRKLSARQANAVNMVTQPVLDASLKQTTVQMQNQIVTEVKSIREFIEHRSELSPEALQQIKDTAATAGADAGAKNAEKAATAAAEAVAAKVSAAQAQIQVEQEVKPFIEKANKANVISILAIVVAAAAIASHFIL